MKSIGIVRKIDGLGRIVVPKEMRDRLFIEEGDPLDIMVEDDAIVIRKSGSCCIFCGKSGERLIPFRGRSICPSCRSELKGEKF